MDPWKSISGLNRSDIRSRQDKQLHHFINRQIYPYSPYYRRVFDENQISPASIRSIEDLKHIPFTSKMSFYNQEGAQTVKDFVLKPDQELIKKYAPKSQLLGMMMKKMTQGPQAVIDDIEKEYRPVFVTFTTGTTSTPSPFLYSNYDISNLHVYGARMLKLFDVPKDEKIVNMFPYAPHLAFWQVVYGGLASNALILSTGGGKVMGTEGNIATILKMKPYLIVGVPSYVYHVCRIAKEKNADLSFLKKIVLGASKVPIAFKQRLAELLHSLGARDVSIFGTYGFTEARTAWGECPTSLDISSGYHLYPDKEIFEIIDPDTLEVKAEGESGELVYTSIDSRASSVIRYRTGDYINGGITYEPCPHCGRTCGRLSSDITRLSNVKDLQLSKVKGALVNLNHFAQTMDEIAGLEEWQIELKKKNDDPFEVDEFIIYACAQSGADIEQLKEVICKSLVVNTEVSPNEVHFIDLKDIIKRLELETANKEKRINDLRPKA